MRGRAPWDTAKIEAWEEAGVRGTVHHQCIGSYDYRKWREDADLLQCRVNIYPLKVSSLAINFPEAGQRDRIWLSPRDAAEKVAERELAEILTSFRPKILKPAVN